MIILLGIYVLAYGVAIAARRASRKAPPATPNSPAAPALPIASLVDPAYYWRGDSGDWTASDERQLIRLLSDSAP